MTKSLLTSEDIRTFILLEIHKLQNSYDECLPFKTIVRRLNINTTMAVEHIHKVPYAYIKGKRKYYKVSKVVKYFLDLGYDVKYCF